jgi:hypothetical protein
MAEYAAAAMHTAARVSPEKGSVLQRNAHMVGKNRTVVEIPPTPSIE